MRFRNDKFKLTPAAAENYDRHSVPAMFGPLAKATLERISLRPDAHVIDIACGTGALTREITEALDGTGRIVGVDLNKTMIDVARTRQSVSSHQVEWYAADVCSLPFPDHSFDYAFIQQGLQFFPDKPTALREVHRVLRPSGLFYLTCWREISPFNGALARSLERHVSASAAEKAKAPFSFRNGTFIDHLLQEAKFTIDRLEAVVLERKFGDLTAQIMALPIEADLRKAGEEVKQQVFSDVASDLAGFNRDGMLHVPQEAHLFCAAALPR